MMIIIIMIIVNLYLPLSPSLSPRFPILNGPDLARKNPESGPPPLPTRPPHENTFFTRPENTHEKFITARRPGSRGSGNANPTAGEQVSVRDILLPRLLCRDPFSPVPFGPETRRSVTPIMHPTALACLTRPARPARTSDGADGGRTRLRVGSAASRT
jgi:hypothetical protein